MASLLVPQFLLHLLRGVARGKGENKSNGEQTGGGGADNQRAAPGHIIGLLISQSPHHLAQRWKDIPSRKVSLG